MKLLEAKWLEMNKTIFSYFQKAIQSQQSGRIKLNAIIKILQKDDILIHTSF